MGTERLDDALARGRGALLWVSVFAFSDLSTKVALQRSGHPSVHLSLREHGLSGSPFASRFLNPIWTRVERRYLKERVVLDSRAPSSAMLRLRGALRKNQVVTITVSPHGGPAREINFLDGHLTVPIGAVRLARLTGAPLVPGFTIRESSDGSTRVDGRDSLHLHDPLDVSSLDRVLVDYGALLEQHVARAPDQWRGWRRAWRPASPIRPE